MNIGPFGCLASLVHAVIFTALEGIGIAIVVAIILKIVTGSVEQSPFVPIMAVILGIVFLFQLVNALAASEAMATEAKMRGVSDWHDGDR